MVLPGLSPFVQSHLQQLCDELTRILGPRLVSIVAFGSAVRGGWRDGASGMDLVVVLTDDSATTLQSIAEALRLARTTARIECALHLESELARSADVFPLLFDEIRSKHVLLAGKDVFHDLVVEDTHRRLRTEQELREASMELRRMLTEQVGDRRWLSAALARFIRQTRGALHAALVLQKLACDDSLESVMQALCVRYGGNHKHLLDTNDDPLRAWSSLSAIISKAVDDVDRLEDGDHSAKTEEATTA